MNKKEGMMRIIKLNILILMLFIIVLSSFTVFAKDVVVKGGELTLQENFIVNNSNFFVNISNARVGIGTAAPTQILDVRGNITTTGILGVGSSSIILSNQNDLYNTETLQIYSNISDATNRRGYIGIRNDGLLQSGIEFVENNSGVLGELIRFRINNGAETAILNVTGFNLLTGANLTTQGDIFISGNSVKTWLYNQTTPANTFTTSQGYITSAVGNSTYIKLGATDSVRIKYQNITNIPTCTANQRLTFDGTTLSCSDIGASASSPWSYNATTIYNDTSGVKIGIGTVNPISLFDVKGTTTITGSGVPGGSGSLELQYANGIGEILAYNRSANAWLSLRLRGNPIKLYGESGDKGIDITSAGNVGIGTTTPQNLLNIITTSTGYVDLVNVSTTVDPQAGATRLLVSNPKGAVYLSQYGSGAPGKLGNNSAVFSISTNLILHASDGIIFGLPSPYTTPKMFLNTSSGNLGIGTTTPTQALHVVGSINTTGDIWILGDDINRGLSASAAPATTLSKGFNGIMQEMVEIMVEMVEVYIFLGVELVIQLEEMLGQFILDGEEQGQLMEMMEL
ncbi:hypothetical protein HYW74_00270 [Candidatus Pacearchaeota archaeon]|nr:hypothetical protein [Candidatus Pacearchaeota archaeon]